MRFHFLLLPRMIGCFWGILVVPDSPLVSRLLLLSVGVPFVLLLLQVPEVRSGVFVALGTEKSCGRNSGESGAALSDNRLHVYITCG
ncbi:hypothetical protein NDU88_002430 [Pleurodeles waltl]|uniref:Secreted protein n=1 Tax=Pleurodeles waltl TaxID=8319 RepID=A0AAV7QCM0_PLEWA|nr:hypothetical protein NDU88_002430 [Pleurodeles waltl]